MENVPQNPRQEGREGAPNRWSILMLAVMSPFMGTLDSNIVNIALPVMAKNLHVTSSGIAWVASVYMIVLTASILFFGRLGDLYGHTRVFRYGMLVFTGGSLLCSLSPSFAVLLAARGVQALGAAAFMATSQGIITRAFPLRERGRALGINGAFVALGTLAGPSVGGFLISVAGWPLLFWINVPIGLAVFIAGLFVFPRGQKAAGGRLDVWGALLFAASMVLLFAGLQNGQGAGFGSPSILACFGGAVLAFLAFLVLQRRRAEPLLQLGIFRNKWFTISVFCAFTSYVAISCYNIVFPFYLQDALHKSASMAGLYMTVYPVVITVASPASGWLTDRVGGEMLTFFGLVLTSAGLLLMTTLTAQPLIGLMLLFLVVTALGNGLFQAPNNALVMSSVPRESVGVGGSVNALVRCVGQTAGIAFATVLLYGGMSLRLGRHVTDYLPGQDEAFLFGMRLAYGAAAGVCLVGAAITAARLYGRRKTKNAGAPALAQSPAAADAAGTNAGGGGNGAAPDAP